MVLNIMIVKLTMIVPIKIKIIITIIIKILIKTKQQLKIDKLLVN